MISTKKEPSNAKKLNYLLHKSVHGQQKGSKQKTSLKSEEKEINQSFTKTALFPAISPHQRCQQIATQSFSMGSTLKSPPIRQSDFRNSTVTQISGKQYIEVNKSILKMIEEKIYPMNKDLAYKLKFKNNLSCQTTRNTPRGKNEKVDGSILQNKPIQKDDSNKKRHKKKQARRISNIFEQRLQMTNRQKRTKSQEEIIRLQAKVESYLRDRKKLLKVKYDQEMQSLIQNSVNQTPKVAIQTKQEAIQGVFKHFLPRHSSQKFETNFVRSPNNSFSKKQRQSELKRVIKLFQQRGNNFTHLQTDRKKKTRFQLIESSQMKKDNLKDLTGVSTKDLSQSLKMISNIVNRKYEEVKDIAHIEMKQGNQCEKEVEKIVQGDKSLRNQQKEKSEKKLSTKKLQTPSIKPKEQIIPNKSSPNTPSTKRNIKIVTDLPNKQNNNISEECAKYDLLDQKSYRILPSKQGKLLDRELLGQIHHELLDEKKNLMKKKINEKKLMMRGKDSYVYGMSII